MQPSNAAKTTNQLWRSFETVQSMDKDRASLKTTAVGV
jgi:hypothetical protein